MSSDSRLPPGNPMEPTEPLDAGQAAGMRDELPNPGSTPQEHDSAVTRAEKFERPTLANERQDDESPPSKRVKLDSNDDLNPSTTPNERRKGVAPIKAECVPMRLFHPSSLTDLIGILYIHLGAERTRALRAPMLVPTETCLM